MTVFYTEGTKIREIHKTKQVRFFTDNVVIVYKTEEGTSSIMIGKEELLMIDENL